MKRIIILLALLMALSPLVAAQENMGARPIALGGAFAGLADDANAIFLNPAGLAYAKGELASISSKLAAGTEYTVLGGVEKTPLGNIGIGYISSGYNLAAPATVTAGTDPGDIAVKSIDQTLVLSYARKLNDFMVVPPALGALSLGTNLKFSSSRLNNAKGLSTQVGSGVDLDLAAMFQSNENLTWGFCFRDLLADGNERAVTGGIAGKLLAGVVTWSIEGKSLGIEVKMIPELALRAGRDGSYNTAGVGLNLGGFGVDYAYLAKPAPVHYVGVSIAIAPEPKDARVAAVPTE